MVYNATPYDSVCMVVHVQLSETCHNCVLNILVFVLISLSKWSVCDSNPTNDGGVCSILDMCSHKSHTHTHTLHYHVRLISIDINFFSPFLFQLSCLFIIVTMKYHFLCKMNHLAAITCFLWPSKWITQAGWSWRFFWVSFNYMQHWKADEVKLSKQTTLMSLLISWAL